MSRSWTNKSSSLLKDNSWIRRPDDEDEDIDRDPNFGKSVLSGYKPEDTPGSEETISTTTTNRTSVQSLSKRFSSTPDEPRSSTLPSSRTTSSYTKSTYSTLNSDSPTSTTTTTISKDGKTETTVTTTESIRSPVIKSPTTFTERVKTSSRDPIYSNYSPTRTTKVTETVTSNKGAEDKLFDTLIPSAIKDDSPPTDRKTTVTTETVIVKSPDTNEAEDHLFNTLVPLSTKDDYSPTDSKTTVTSTETVTVKSSPIGNGTKTTTTTRTSSMPEDDLYGTLLPKSITSATSLSSPIRVESPTLPSPSSTRRSYSSYTDDLPSTRTTSYTISSTPSYDYSSLNSPTSYSTKYRTSSRSDDTLGDQIYSSSVKSVYTTPERTVLEKDLCSYCRKPFSADAKMVLDDMKINCHASCFKCEVCNSTLGHMKAGDSLWIYKQMVHCENCFEITREKWRR